MRTIFAAHTLVLSHIPPLWYFRLSPRCRWGLRSSAISCCVSWQRVTDFSVPIGCPEKSLNICQHTLHNVVTSQYSKEFCNINTCITAQRILPIRRSLYSILSNIWCCLMLHKKMKDAQPLRQEWSVLWKKQFASAFDENQIPYTVVNLSTYIQ
jgi:hypothetical protein